MKTLTFLLLAFVMCFMTTAHGAYKPNYQKNKFPSQWLLEKTRASAPVTASSNNVLSLVNGATTATAITVTTFLAQPDVPRNLVVTPGGTTADVGAGNVVITGTDYSGNTISESLAIIANQTTASTGSKAFRSIVSIAFPAEDSPYGALWSVGVGTKLGLQGCLDGTGWYWKGLVDGVDLTGSTIASDDDEVSKNTIIPNPAPNSSRVFDLLYFPNYNCY